MKNQSRKKLITLVTGIGFLVILGIYFYLNSPEQNVPKIEVKTFNPPKEDVVEETELPTSRLLAVPFTPQAPFANWNIHEESCEEAAILMYHSYLLGISTDFPAKEADEALRTLKKWQVEHYGKERDLSILEVGKLATDYYGEKYNTVEFTMESFKKSIANGHPVLVPVMTHSLGNVHYGAQDTYHVLLIKGFNPSGFITNDAGIKSGKDQVYSWETIKRAVNAQTVSPKLGIILTK